jgi:polyhydroxyalkanoate synthase
MRASAGLDLTWIPERIQSEVQRAIQRSIKGVEYIASSGPVLGSTPKDTLHVRGTMNLYHYRPMADDIYRVPILIVMATTNRGYILDMVPGQSFIEYLLRCGYDVYMLDWTPPKPEEKHLRMEDYVLDFIPDCIRHVQRDSGETDVSVIGYCFGGVLSLLYGSIFNDGPMKNLICFTTPIDFRGMQLFSNFADRPLFRRRSPCRQRRQSAAGDDPFVLRYAAASLARHKQGAIVGEHLERRIRQVVSHVRSLGHRHSAVGRRVFPHHHQRPDVGQ